MVRMLSFCWSPDNRIWVFEVTPWGAAVLCPRGETTKPQSSVRARTEFGRIMVKARRLPSDH